MVLDEPNYFEIKRNKLHLAANLLIGIGLIYYFGNRLDGDIERGRYFWIILDIIMIVFALQGIVKQFNILRKGVPILSIKNAGIYMENFGFLPKEDIKEVTISDTTPDKSYIIVQLNDPEGFIAKQNGFRRTLFSAIYKERGTPIATRLKGNYDRAALENAIQQFLKGIYK